MKGNTNAAQDSSQGRPQGSSRDSFEVRKPKQDRPVPQASRTLPDTYHRCGRCLFAQKVEGHGLPAGWTVVQDKRTGRHDQLRCMTCVGEVANGSPEEL